MTARLVAAYLAGFTAFAVARHDRRIVAYLLVAAVVGGALWLGHRLRPFPPSLQLAVAGCGFLHLLGGLAPSPTRNAPVFYETWIVTGVLKFDQVVHFAASAVLTAVAWHVLVRWLDAGRTPPAVRAVLAVLVAVGFGAVNEVFEFLSGLRFADAYVGGLDNAGWDLVFNTFGSATVAVLLVTGRGRAGACPTPTRTSTASRSPRRDPRPAAPSTVPDPWRADPTRVPEAARPRT